MRSLGRFSEATIAIGVFPLFLPLAITAFGGLEGHFSLSMIAFGHLSSLSPNATNLGRNILCFRPYKD